MKLQIPYDEVAEQEVVGTAVATPAGYRIAVDVVAVDDFYVPAHARLFRACAGLEDVEAGWDSSERIRLASHAAEVDSDTVDALVFDRSLYHDIHARFPRRVALTAQRRRAMAAAAEAYNALGSGAGVGDAMALLAPFIVGRSWAA